jgi:selenide,water dikinase
MGLVHPSHLKRNANAKVGDQLILGKPLGVGILSAALKKNALDAEGYQAMIQSTTKLNTAGKDLAKLAGVHAMTDVTGFGLLGHAREMARGANVQLQINMQALPFLQQVETLAAQGFITGASARNWNGYQQDITLDSKISDVQKALLCDPQTSGGLLVACAPDTVDEVMTCFHAHGFSEATVIGEIQKGDARVHVKN